MKKKILSFTLALFLVSLILFLPIPKGSYDDGGTREYVSLTYKIVDWNRLTDTGVYEKTRIFFGEDRRKAIDELWAYEAEYIQHTFLATILDINQHSALVKPLEGEEEGNSSSRITFRITQLEQIDVQPGEVVEIRYQGEIMESDPAQIKATIWQKAKDIS